MAKPMDPQRWLQASAVAQPSSITFDYSSPCNIYTPG